MADPKPKVLIKEKIADSGVDLLRAKYDVELGVDWSDDELQKRIGEFDALLVRSATQVDAPLIDKADNLKVIGRAGVGVDNIDIPPPPSAASSSPTRPSPTSSPPRSTHSRC